MLFYFYSNENWWCTEGEEEEVRAKNFTPLNSSVVKSLIAYSERLLVPVVARTHAWRFTHIHVVREAVTRRSRSFLDIHFIDRFRFWVYDHHSPYRRFLRRIQSGRRRIIEKGVVGGLGIIKWMGWGKNAIPTKFRTVQSKQVNPKLCFWWSSDSLHGIFILINGLRDTITSSKRSKWEIHQ